MQLQRLYRHDAPPDDWTVRRDPCGECHGKGVVINEAGDGVEPCPADCDHGSLVTKVPPVGGLKLLHTGGHARQNFSVTFVTDGIRSGWIQIYGDTLTLTTEEAALKYKILRPPGRHCCHCGERLPDDLTGELARLHVAVKHPATASPDPANPAGYLLTNAYECELDAKQHAQWRAGRG